MLKYTSRSLLWVLLLIVVLPLSAYASHEWQGTASGDVRGAGDESEAKGLIESFPSELVGDWVIGGVTYVADASTQFEQKDGAFAVDVCVEVTFQRSGASNTATKIESQDAEECRGDGGGEGENDNEAKGLIESFPSELVGDWVIGGVTYVADESTQFEQKHGAFAVDVCVEVTFQRSGASNTATKIESKEPQECRGDDDDDDDDDNDDLKAYGLVESFPADLVGDWVIGGVTYTADASTEFEQEHGAFAVGACVEIKYLPTSNQALEIESEHSYKCDGSNGESGESYSETKGVVESFPSALIGTWVVDGVSYSADASTRFEQEDGPFFVGGCVEIKYTSSDNAAVEIESKEASDCGGGSDDGSSNSRSKSYGLIETMPEGLIGSWTIGGMTFEATESTQFEQEDGDFAVGMCVEVTYTTANDVNSATEIESEDAYRCSGGSSMNKVYGTVDSFPSGLYGTWVISGTNYVASPSTRFEEEDGSFAVGGCVKVKYYTENGVNQATKIESENDSCGGGDSSESESSTKVYATIDSFPPSPYVGTWQIGGLTYDATNATEFDEDHAPFAVGACVEAKYTTLRQAQGAPSNTLIEVESENAYKCGGDGQAEFTTYGTVETMPTTADRTGTWQISGVAYEANESTQFEQEYGFFAVGAYVEVKYEMSGDSAIAKSIETHVAPGNGMQTGQGTLQSHDANDDWKDWVIQGVTYKADPAIEVGSGEQAPQVGESVSFNSYENNGARYLTSVNRTQQHLLFLPAVTR
ncbi:MAG: DUF5666 domain-containing protein [Ardenticatenaceae bacterium]